MPRRAMAATCWPACSPMPPLRATTTTRYYNSVVSIGDGAAAALPQAPPGAVRRDPSRRSPSSAGSSARVLAIPLADQTPGAADQPPMAAAGQRVAVNICYEDAFGGELRPAGAVGNAAGQRHQRRLVRPLARRRAAQRRSRAMRALESGRPMLRATNTGITAVIDHRGRELRACPGSRAACSKASIAGRTGATPYVRCGDAIALGSALARSLSRWPLCASGDARRRGDSRLAVDALAQAHANRRAGRLLARLFGRGASHPVKSVPFAPPAAPC